MSTPSYKRGISLTSKRVNFKCGDLSKLYESNTPNALKRLSFLKNALTWSNSHLIFGYWIRYLNFLMWMSCDKLNISLWLPIPYTPQGWIKTEASSDVGESYPNTRPFTWVLRAIWTVCSSYLCFSTRTQLQTNSFCVPVQLLAMFQDFGTHTPIDNC